MGYECYSHAKIASDYFSHMLKVLPLTMNVDHIFPVM